MSLNTSESESSTAMEVLSPLMARRGLYGVIALKGLPSTCKTEVGERIGRWANCPVLCIQDFIGGGGGRADYFKGTEADFSPPTSTNQVERHHRKAFTALLNVALRHLSNRVGYNCVVIKSSLNTQFELQQLLQLTSQEYWGKEHCRLVILECKIRNKYLWKRRFEVFSFRYKESNNWSRLRSWKDIEKDVDDNDEAQPVSWDLNHLHRLLKFGDEDDYVALLQVDPFYDLGLSHFGPSDKPLPDEFNDAIKYLLTAPKTELPAPNPYVMDYDELRRFLFDQKLRAAALKGRSQSFCDGDCVFRYWEAYEADFCGVCQGQISSKPGYTCYFCVTTLHKTCAERFPIKAPKSTRIDFQYFTSQRSVQHPCKACEVGGKEFSKECRSCILQDRLKCQLLPTIFHHDSHQHFLSIQIHKRDSFRCKACRKFSSYGFGCRRCAFYCHMECVFLPLEVKHEHGGHEHVMKLMYTRVSMEDEEDPCWCDCCYQDMDPELWFYSCLVCPHYFVHHYCSDAYHLSIDDPKMVKFVEQFQSQLDNWRAAKNSS